jgi:hypothetical protein
MPSQTSRFILHVKLCPSPSPDTSQSILATKSLRMLKPAVSFRGWFCFLQCDFFKDRLHIYSITQLNRLYCDSIYWTTTLYICRVQMLLRCRYVGDVCLVCQGGTLAVYGLVRGSSHFAWKFDGMRANSVEVGTLGLSSSCNIFWYWQEIKTVLYPIPAQTTINHRQYAGSGGGDEYVTPHRVAPL